MAQLDSTPNFTDLYAQAFQTGQAAAKSKGVQNALAMSPTDPVGAQAELVRYGAFPEANALAQVNSQQRALALRAQAAPQVSSGDMQGAEKTYAAGGDFDTAAAIGKLDDSQRARAAAVTDVMAQGLYGLRQLPEDTQTRQAALQKIAPVLLGQGVPQSMIDRAMQTDLSNNTLDAAAHATLSLKDQLTQGQKDREDAETARHNVATENPVHYATLKDQMGNESLVVAGGAPATGAAAQPAAGGSATPAPAGGPSVPRGLRNNNPLNLEASVNWSGMTGSDGRYAQFDSPASGWAAADHNLQTYNTAHGINTVAGVINRWTPSSENGQQTNNEVANIAKQLGVDPNAPINLQDPGVRRSLLQAMATVENGRPVTYGSGVAPQASAPAGQASPSAAPAATPGGARVLYSTATPAASAANSNLTGQDYLKTLPANQARTVQALAEGRMQFPNGFALKQPYWQNMMSAVGQYDPQFDAVNYNARSKARADFTSGKSAQNITAINTLVGHLGSLDTAIDKLGNTPIPLFNSLSNGIENAVGLPQVTNFNAIKTAVVDELPKVFQGNGGALGDRTAWESKLDAAQSPSQLHGVVKQLVELLGSRVSAIGDTYNAGMGTTKDPMELLHPEAAATLRRLSGEGGSGQAAPAAAPAQAPAASGPRLTVQQAAALKPGTPFVGMDGVARVRH